MKLLSATGFILVLLSGCASTSTIAPVRMASSQEAVFYVIRKQYPPTAWTGELTANDTVAASVKDNSYVKINVPVGRAAVALKFAPLLGLSNAPFFVDVNPNETRYMLLTGDVSYAGMDFQGAKYKWSLNAVELNANAAQKIIEAMDKR